MDVIEGRALHVRNYIINKRPPIRFLGQRVEDIIDVDWNLRTMVERFKEIAREAFCIGGISDVHDADRYDSNPNDDGIPVLDSYAAGSPPKLDTLEDRRRKRNECG